MACPPAGRRTGTAERLAGSESRCRRGPFCRRLSTAARAPPRGRARHRPDPEPPGSRRGGRRQVRSGRRPRPVLPHAVGDVRDERGQDLGQGGQHRAGSRTRPACWRPARLSRSVADFAGRTSSKAVHERLGVARGTCRVIPVQAVLHVRHQPIEAQRIQRSIRGRLLAGSPAAASGGLPALPGAGVQPSRRAYITKKL